MLLLAFLCLPLLAQSQEAADRYQLMASVGTNVPVGKEFNHAHGPGFYGQIGIGIKTYKSLYLGPVMDYSYHLKHYTEKLDEQFDSFGFGLGAYYPISVREKIQITPMLKVFRVSYKDQYHLRERSGRSLAVLDGTDMAYDIGVAASYSRWSLNLSYRFLYANPKFNRDFYEQYAFHNRLYEIYALKDRYAMNFSSITLSLGVKIGSK